LIRALFAFGQAIAKSLIGMRFCREIAGFAVLS